MNFYLHVGLELVAREMSLKDKSKFPLLTYPK